MHPLSGINDAPHRLAKLRPQNRAFRIIVFAKEEMFSPDHRSSPRQDHHHAIAVVIWKLTGSDCLDSHIWLRAVEAELG